MKTNQFIILAIALVLLSSSLTYFFYYQHNVVKMEKIDFDFQLKEKEMGFNLDKDKLHFGVFMPGGTSSMRAINISNNFDFPVELTSKVYGLKAGNIQVPENGFLLNPGETKEIVLAASAPRGTPLGNYSGTIVFLFKKV